jgi:hypothetical protein
MHSIVAMREASGLARPDPGEALHLLVIVAEAP